MPHPGPYDKYGKPIHVPKPDKLPKGGSGISSSKPGVK